MTFASIWKGNYYIEPLAGPQKSSSGRIRFASGNAEGYVAACLTISMRIPDDLITGAGIV